MSRSSFRSVARACNFAASVSTRSAASLRSAQLQRSLLCATALAGLTMLMAPETALAADECGVAAPGSTVNCAAGSYTAGITYNVSDLTLNANGPILIGSATTPVAGVGIFNLGAGLSTITTVGNVSVYTAGDYDYGIYASSSGNANAVITTSAGTDVHTQAVNGAYGLFALAQGSGTLRAGINGASK